MRGTDMISNQIIQTSIDELKAITKVDIYVFDLDGIKVAATTEDIEIPREIITGFAASPADSQVVGGYHFLKVLDDSEVAYVLASRSNNDDAYMVGKIAVSQIQNLIIAYKERFDRNNFFQNLILDNLLLVDIYNRAQKLHIEVEGPRIVYLVETRLEKDSSGMELLRSLFSSQNGDYITAVDEKNIILIKAVERDASPESLELIANTIVDMMNSEAMLKVRVSYGTVVQELREVSKSYKEATMAMDVGRIFYAEKNVIAYSTLGIGRLIYQLPVNLCRIFIEEIFGGNQVYDLDEETLTTINKFFENNLNVSETSRQLFIHRNTLVYRIEKLQKATGLDIRTFEDAMTFKIAMMVVNYMKEGVDISVEDFYQMMADRAGTFPKTSMPSVQDYVDVFEKYAKDGVPVLCICLNAAFSGSIQSAMNAKNQILEDYPEAQIEVVDSEEVTALQGMFVEEACRLRGAELDLKEAVKLLEEIRPTGRIFFTTNDLDYLQHGGRIGRAAATIGNVLKIKPMIEYVNKELVSAGVSRGRKKSLQSVIDKAKAYIEADHIDLKEYRIGLECGLDKEEFGKFEEQVKAAFRDYEGEIKRFEVFHVGATIGVHTGPYPTGIALLKRCRY